jgi:Mrp family chromosome partitioning ATPase
MIVSTFSGSKGGVGKTTLAVSLSIAASVRGIPTLLVDTSAEGGATAYLLGANVEPPYLSSGDVLGALRQVVLFEDEGYSARVTVAVNRGPLRDVRGVAERLRGLAEQYRLIIIDVPALTDLEAVERYMPLFEVADAILIVVEPNLASLRSALYTFRDKRLVVALNCPRPYSPAIIDFYRRYVEAFSRRTGARYVVVSYSPALSLLSADRLNVLERADDSFVASIAELAKLLLSHK